MFVAGWKEGFEDVSVATQRELLDLSSQLCGPLGSQLFLLWGGLLAESLQNGPLEHIAEDRLTAEHLGVDDGDAGEQLCQVVLDEGARQQDTPIAPESLQLKQQLTLPVLHAVALVEDKQITPPRQPLHVPVECLVAND